MQKDALIDALLVRIDRGASASELIENAVRDADPELHKAGLRVFGTWERTLAELSVIARGMAEELRVAVESAPSSSVTDVDRPERKVGASSERPLIVLTPEGQILWMPLNTLGASPSPRLIELPSGPASFTVDKLVLASLDTGLALFTTGGNAVMLDRRMVAEWKPGEHVRPLRNRFPDLVEHEGIAHVLSMPSLRTQDRYYTVSRMGQIKASDCKEIQRLSRDATVAFLLKDGDELITAFAGTRKAHVYVAGSHGKAIHFGTSDIRSQGRRATGVRAIGLGTGEEVIGAFPMRSEKRNIGLVTRQGLFKRMPVSEFKAQGRAGGGLQTCRLNSGDHVVAVASVDLAGDVVVLTSKGRFARFPAYDLPFGGRATKGDALLDLDGDETVTRMSAVPAGEFVL